VREIVDAYRSQPPQAPFNRIPVFRRPACRCGRKSSASTGPPRAAPRPARAGTDQQLHELIADLHAPILERHRPGWKVYVIDGLSGGRFAIYQRSTTPSSTANPLMVHPARSLGTSRRPNDPPPSAWMPCRLAVDEAW